MIVNREIRNALIQILYWTTRVAAFPLLVFYFLYRCASDPRYWRGFGERFGAAPHSFQPTPPGAIWLHAVSVGEVASAESVLRELRQRRPNVALYLSVTTVAGREIAEQRLHAIVDGIFHAPIDYAFAVDRVLARIRPALVVILETEIWPTLYREIKRVGCGLVVLNARISDRALPRYRRWRFFFADALARPDLILTQSDQDTRRYLELGGRPESVRTIGNLKYDAPPITAPPPALVASLIEKLQPTAIWIAASTMAGVNSSDVDEDDLVIAAFRELCPKFPRLLLILVPRKPERFDEVARKLKNAGVAYLRRSQNVVPADLALPCVLLVDSMGELGSLFPLAGVVFMGGTLAQRGGHNVLEPAAVRRAIIVGPHMENFAAIASEFRERRAFLEIAAADQLAPRIAELLDAPAAREELGARAAQLAAEKRGATRQSVAEILRQHDLAVPSWNQLSPARWLLWPLAKLWASVSERAIRKKAAQARRLSTPVISVGGISMGGAGKTPVVQHLAESLTDRGFHAAILTRGYRRQSIEPAIVIEAGHEAPVRITGDEAQIFVQSASAHLGIGADRYRAGRLLESKFHTDVFLLDDGFQHVRLYRDLDIVVIDALNPFTGGATFPLGALREPLSALARAGAFIIMRTVPDREYHGIHRQLRRWNEHAPIFHARVEPRGWINYVTRQPAQLQGSVAAFCGLANPFSFWATLRSLQLSPVFHWAFPDHHAYNWRQLRRLAEQALAHGARVLLTTEKDAMNLPDSAPRVLAHAGVALYWLNIGVHVDNGDQLLDLVQSKLRPRQPNDRAEAPASRQVARDRIDR